ncbi:MAG: HesA/MoeB/ThiF family protein [[Clostridium] scindens]
MGRERPRERLERASVLVVGAGGLGCPVLTALAEAGVGRIGIMDGDVVERSNLNRQYLYTPSDIGKRKAACAGAWLQRFRPDIEFEISGRNVADPGRMGKEIASSFDLVICAVDKVKTRLLINRLAKEAGKPLIDGAIDGHYGTVTAVTARQDPCLACMNPQGERTLTYGQIPWEPLRQIVGALRPKLAVAYLAGQERKEAACCLRWNLMEPWRKSPRFEQSFMSDMWSSMTVKLTNY